jgi:hypothetical protein
MICSFKTVEQKQNSSIFLNQEKDVIVTAIAKNQKK